MTSLTAKQRTKVNAALCMIHDFGLDAQAIVTAAAAIVSKGQAPNIAYEQTLNAVANEHPELAMAMGKVTRLIEASSSNTVTQYDHAISQYIETGNDAALNALAPMIVADSVALAIHNGEVAEGDTGAEALVLALGYQPGDVLQQAYASALAAPAAAAGGAPNETSSDWAASQASPIEGPGLVASKARFAYAHYSGFSPDTPAVNGVTPAAAREAARIDAGGISRTNVPDQAM